MYAYICVLKACIATQCTGVFMFCESGGRGERKHETDNIGFDVLNARSSALS